MAARWGSRACKEDSGKPPTTAAPTRRSWERGWRWPGEALAIVWAGDVWAGLDPGSIQPGSVLRPLLSGSFLSIFSVKAPGSEPTCGMSGGSGHSEHLQTLLLWILLFPVCKLRMGHQLGEDRFKQRTCWLTLALLGRRPQAGKV